ncbi:MAG: hypothetical protein E7500_02150 [Ruminococcus sp.]|nr:hypothetical protein [Ruminococcus sp.]
MNIRKLASVITAVLIVPFHCFNSVYAESAEQETHTVTFWSFDKSEELASFEIEHGEAIDYSAVDTSALNTHLDKVTERRFLCWDQMPETAEEDLDIHALYEEARIDLVSLPNLLSYDTKTGPIDLTGLSVTVTITSQTAEFDDDGQRICKTNVVDVSESCETVPADLDTAFAESDTADVSIYPAGSATAITTYTISYKDTETPVEPDPDKHSVTFYGFDKEEVICTLELEEGELIDYSAIDTELLHTHLDKFTERRFLCWDSTPESVTEDIEIQALYEEAKIELVSLPSKTVYYDKTGNINLDGLKVTITIKTQTNVFDENDERISEINVVDITQSCKTLPENLETAFSESDTAVISIYPAGSSTALDNYSISYVSGLGDVNLDGSVSPVDASLVLSHYADVNTGAEDSESLLKPEQCDNADTNKDGSITTVDAAKILSYYADSATSGNASWS